MNVAKARCVEVDCKRTRSMLAKFRGGAAELRIESGRWRCMEPCPLCVPFYLTVGLCRLLRLGSCEILERGGRLVGVILSADTCIFA